MCACFLCIVFSLALSVLDADPKFIELVLKQADKLVRSVFTVAS